ncbi:hypothetical protein GEMRC1_000716 [Eukaryota sp. GEM-RC1]
MHKMEDFPYVCQFMNGFLTEITLDADHFTTPPHPNVREIIADLYNTHVCNKTIYDGNPLSADNYSGHSLVPRSSSHSSLTVNNIFVQNINISIKDLFPTGFSTSRSPSNAASTGCLPPAKKKKSM